MLPKVANTILHSTSRAAAAVHGQSHTFRNVLQLQHNSTSSSSQQSSSSQSSSSGSGPNGPAGQGPGSNFFNPNWHGTPGARDGTPRGPRFTHNYLGASRAVSQAQPFVSTSDGPVQFDENQDEYELVVPRPSQNAPTRRFRSHSLSYSSKERAQKLGVLRTVQLHARSKHVFASPERPDHVEASVGECVRPVSPTRLVRSRSNSTATVSASESEGLMDGKGLSPPPPPPAQILETSTDPASPQSVVPPSQPSESSADSASFSNASSENREDSAWWRALWVARRSGDPEEATKVVQAFRSAISLAFESSPASPSLSSPAPRSTKPSLPPGAHIPTLPELNLALEALFATRKPGEPLTLILQVYGDIIKFGQLLSEQGKSTEAIAMKPNQRTYYTMIQALCDREAEVVWAIEGIGMRSKWKTMSKLQNSAASEESELKDVRQLELFKAENNFRSAVALFQAYTNVLGTVESGFKPHARIYSYLLRACATRGVFASAIVPPSPKNPQLAPLFSPSEQQAIVTEAITSAIHVWGHMERYRIVPDPIMYRYMLLVFSRAAGKETVGRGWQGVQDVWADFRSRCAEGGIMWQPEIPDETVLAGSSQDGEHVLARRGLVTVWNAMIEASFRCGEPGVGIELLEDMMRDRASGSNESSKSQSSEHSLDVFDSKQSPLPTPATFTTIIAGFVGLALKAINGVPASDNVSASQLQAARSALEDYKEHMDSALVWINKLASMPTKTPATPLDAPESSGSGVGIPRPDTIAWRTVIEALGQGHLWETDWSARGLELPQQQASSSSTQVPQTYSLPALNSTYDTMQRTTRAHPEDRVFIRRLDIRLVSSGNWRHVHALKGRLNWAVTKGDEILKSSESDKDKIEGIQATIRQARKDLLEMLEREEVLLKDIPGLSTLATPSRMTSLLFSTPSEDFPEVRAVYDIHQLDIEMVKGIYDAWRELGTLKGPSDSASDSEFLLEAQKHSVLMALTFFDQFSRRQTMILENSRSNVLSPAEQSRLEAVRLMVIAFTENFFEKVLPATGTGIWGWRVFSELALIWEKYGLEERLGLNMAVPFAVEFTRASARGEDFSSLTSVTWHAVLAMFVQIQAAPQKVVEELLPSDWHGDLADMSTVVQIVRQYGTSFDPSILSPKLKLGIVTGLCSNKSIEEVEKILTTPPTVSAVPSETDALWVSVFKQTVKAAKLKGIQNSESWLDNHNELGRSTHSGPLIGDEGAVDLAGLGGVAGGEALSDGLSVTEEGSGIGSASGASSTDPSTAPTSPVELTVPQPVEAEQQVHMQQAQIESGTMAPDQYPYPTQPYPAGEYFLGGQSIPSRLYIDRFHTRSMDHLLSRAIASRDPSQMVTEIFDLFVQAVFSGRVPSPFTFARLLQIHGRCKQFEQIQFVYRVAQNMLAQMEHDKKVQSDSWFIVEDAMIIAFAQGGEIDAAHVHRMRILEHGGTPSADAYGGLILHVKDTTDDTSNAMALYQEAVVRGVVPNQYLYNNIISKLAKARKADYALEMFNQMKSSGIRPSSITYGAVIGACARVGDVDSAEILFDEMVSMKNFKPRVPPFNTMMQLYTTTKPNRERSLYYYELMRKHKVNPTEYTYKLLMETYVIEPIDIAKMEQVFKQLVSNRYLVVQGTHFATLINAYGCVAKDLDKAVAVFDSISTHPRGPELDALVFEAMVSVLIAHRRVDLVPEYMAKMSAAGIHMTAYIMNLLIKGYAGAGDVEKARDLFESLLDPPEGVAAAHNHAPHDPRLAMNIDPMAPVYREPSTWEAMVRAELGAGYRERALALLERLKARQYPEAVFNRISGILVDHSQVFP
ncbi:hypothetical protein K435DRAFT_850798 [Dendrothele bispora CBS 962.96]|uniref:PROP1-like PPR domain-containing protein n=1 Tax=Dendrothele bispora (strain CBS 962.96) TaxID=1314807 RepID=A0A4S8MP49_DENBC|nr:hypothetical protein K435DRAFT_850798 [Dendrothele bispora CBS 962.96]